MIRKLICIGLSIVGLLLVSMPSVSAQALPDSLVVSVAAMPSEASTEPSAAQTVHSEAPAEPSAAHAMPSEAPAEPSAAHAMPSEAPAETIASPDSTAAVPAEPIALPDSIAVERVSAVPDSTVTSAPAQPSAAQPFGSAQVPVEPAPGAPSVEPASAPATDPSFAFPLTPSPAPEPTFAELLARGDSLRMQCEFAEALAVYRRSRRSPDATAEDREIASQRMSMAQRGINMTDYCSDPKVIAKQRFLLKDFFLFYPLKNGSWRATPNVLDTLAVGDIPTPTYAPKGAESIYFSAADESGTRNIYRTVDADSCWTAPEILSEKLMSAGNEIYPMLSPDGQTLYFSSDGLYGMGGYDLYSCKWDKETRRWSEPVNMGFPYSSPADDFLLINTDDNRYTIFASNRNCQSRDSVYIYVLEYDAVPKRQQIKDAETLRRLIELRPGSDKFHIDHSSAVSKNMPDNDATQRYSLLVGQIQELRDSIRVATDPRLTQLEDSLELMKAQLKLVESEFLNSGGVFDPDNAKASAEREVIGAESAYTFTKNSLGPRLRIKLSRGTTQKDVFDISPVGRFAQSSVLPDGIIFQIKLMETGYHAEVEDLMGVSPVYERLTNALTYTYSAGIFYSYSAALSKLNSVRALGFDKAEIIAFKNNRPISVVNAINETSGPEAAPSSGSSPSTAPIKPKIVLY